MTNTTKGDMSADAVRSALKPCPFCGHATPEFVRRGTPLHSCIVICGNCGCRHESGDEGAESGRSWNTRETLAEPADEPSDLVIALAEALQVRRILEEIKTVAQIHPADDMPTPFQAAWAGCCEEIFYRATDSRWHMDEDTPQARRAAIAKAKP